MAGPWDKFQSSAPAETTKPWEQFQAPAAKSQDEQFADDARKFQADVRQRQNDEAYKAGASTGKDIAMFLPNAVAGAVRGAGSIGSTLLAPIDMTADALDGKGLSLDSNRKRRTGIDQGLQSIGADPTSLGYWTGKLGGEIAGTMGVGPALAIPLRAAGVSPSLVQAVATSGMRAGAPAAGALGAATNLGTRMVGGAVTGGAAAGLVNPEDVALGAGIGGLLPPGLSAVGKLGRVAGRAFGGAPVKDEVQALALRAKELGIDVPVDRIANSKPLNAIAAGLNYVPFSGRAATEAKMQSQLNRALSRTFGQDSDNVTMAMRKAQGDLGGEFDRVLQSNTVKVDSQFLNELADAEATAARELGADGAGVISRQIDEIMSKGASGQIDGQAAYNIKKMLDRIGKRSTPEAYYAGDLRRSLMGALDRSMAPDAAAAFAATRKQYGNMLSLEKLAQNGAEGDVSIARIANMKNINNPDLQELADISAQFLKPREGQHGAAQRAAAGLGIGTMGGPAALAASVAGGRAVNSVMNSQTARDLLLRQLSLGRVPELVQPAYRAAPLLGDQ